MPNLNGHELCTKLKQLNPKLEMIIMSAYDTIECNTSEFTFIKKPILMDNYYRLLRISWNKIIFIIFLFAIDHFS